MRQAVALYCPLAVAAASCQAGGTRCMLGWLTLHVVLHPDCAAAELSMPASLPPCP